MRKHFQKLREKGLKKSYHILRTKIYDRYFDNKYGINTNGIVTLGDLDINEREKEHAYWYVGTKVLPLKILFEKLKIPKKNVFVDIGSGKGRVLLVAAEYGFEIIRGVELSHNLCKIADKNIDFFKKKNKNEHVSFTIENMDATQYELKDDERILFFYNPFDEHILEKVLNNIERSLKRNKRQITIIYVNPLHGDVIEKNMNIKNYRNLNLLNVSFAIYDI